MTKDELKLALKHAKRDERHLSNVETRYWCDQYKLLATQAIEALAQPEPWEKFCDSNCVWTDHHPDCKLAQPEQVALVKEMRDVQGQHGNWNYDPYMQGLYNGLEFAVSLLERREPEFRNAPEAWIGDIRIKRDNFGSAEPLTAAHGIGGES